VKYAVTVTPQEWAGAYIEFFARTAARAFKISPPARVSFSAGRALLKFTAVGKRFRHHIYVELCTEDNRGVFVVKPPYPMYLLGVVAPFLALPSYPMYAAREGESIRVVLTQGYDEAVKNIADALTHSHLLDPADFLDDTASFEGYLYELPIGYVAFLEEKPGFGDYLDEIEMHEEEEEEEENIMYPGDFFAKIMGEILKNV